LDPTASEVDWLNLVTPGRIAIGGVFGDPDVPFAAPLCKSTMPLGGLGLGGMLAANEPLRGDVGGEGGGGPN
jgi:hypothetical protein